ncbi:MAG: hypothetical protein K0Q63_2619 [Paenibacillus sp.]|nr:hypothetical protein [Paenibacillus sp.]
MFVALRMEWQVHDIIYNFRHLFILLHAPWHAYRKYPNTKPQSGSTLFPCFGASRLLTSRSIVRPLHDLHIPVSAKLLEPVHVSLPILFQMFVARYELKRVFFDVIPNA